MKKISIIIILVIFSYASYFFLQENHTAGLETISIPISGMSCDACSQSIENTLSGLEGVSNCSVSFKEKKVTITFNPKKSNLAKLTQTIQNEGYNIPIR